MRKELTAQLDEFLEKGVFTRICRSADRSLTSLRPECSTFIDTLFTVLRTKSYLPYATDSAPKGPRADSGIPIPLESGASLPDSRGQKRSMEYDDRDGRPTKGPRLNDGPGQFPRLPNGMNQQPWNGNGLGGMMGMGGGGMGVHMNGRRPNAYQPPDMRRGLCRDYHSKFSHPIIMRFTNFASRQWLLCTRRDVQIQPRRRGRRTRPVLPRSVHALYARNVPKRRDAVWRRPRDGRRWRRI